MARQDPDQALLDALRHPLRRSLLRRYVESEEMLSPRELARLERKPLSNVAYHIRELERLGAIEIAATRPVRGAVEHFYLPTSLVKGTSWVLETLDQPEDETP